MKQRSFCQAAAAAATLVVCGCRSHDPSAPGPLRIQSRMQVVGAVTRSEPETGVGGAGYRVCLANGDAHVPVVVVSGSPRDMGWHLGRLLRDEIRAFIPRAVDAMLEHMELTTSDLDEVWLTTAPDIDERLKQEMAGLAAGSGVPIATLRHVHCLPLLMPYSCSSVAAWGTATRDGHLYQTRNLDWSMGIGAHNVPVVIIYRPTTGTPHAVPSFAGFIGAHCGMNTAGIALSEMGDSPADERPYRLDAPHFTAWFRTLLYDAESLRHALDLFSRIPLTKRYHFVFGDGQRDRRAVKIRAHAPEPPEGRVRIWSDNDADDELAPNVLPDVVYQDEGRGAFPILKAQHGRLDAAAMTALCNVLPIEGSNVMNAVFDATACRLWVAYARDAAEAYTRAYVYIDLAGFGDVSLSPPASR